MVRAGAPPMINLLIERSLKNRFLVLGFFLVIGAWGYWALLTTPIDAIPDRTLSHLDSADS